jgi:sugar phosphate isomerase/epimerase
MALDHDDLVLCAGTALHVPFLERLAPARAAGFRGVSLQPPEHARLAAAGMSDAELRSRIADQGLELAEFDAITTWLPDHVPPASFAPEFARALLGQTPEKLIPIAASIGARSLTLVELYGKRLGADALAEEFARVCDLAAAHGVLVHLEFLPWAGIPDLRSAWEVVRRAGRPNGGLLVDSWHFFRSGSKLEDLLALPGDRVLGVQLDDAPAEAGPDLFEETQRSRLLPGEGSFDLVGLIRALDRIGSRAPLGVEIFSDELARRPVDAIARAAFDSTRRVVARARAA